MLQLTAAVLEVCRRTDHLTPVDKELMLDEINSPKTAKKQQKHNISRTAAASVLHHDEFSHSAKCQSTAFWQHLVYIKQLL